MSDAFLDPAVPKVLARTAGPKPRAHWALEGSRVAGCGARLPAQWTPLTIEEADALAAKERCAKGACALWWDREALCDWRDYLSDELEVVKHELHAARVEAARARQQARDARFAASMALHFADERFRSYDAPPPTIDDARAEMRRRLKTTAEVQHELIHGRLETRPGNRVVYSRQFLLSTGQYGQSSRGTVVELHELLGGPPVDSDRARFALVKWDDEGSWEVSLEALAHPGTARAVECDLEVQPPPIGAGRGRAHAALALAHQQARRARQEGIAR